LWREAGFNEMDRGLASVGKYLERVPLLYGMCFGPVIFVQPGHTLAFVSLCACLEGQEPFSEWATGCKDSQWAKRVEVTALRSGVPRAPL
jgi:hypothetical protein